jgi:hypothetical protein
MAPECTGSAKHSVFVRGSFWGREWAVMRDRSEGIAEPARGRGERGQHPAKAGIKSAYQFRGNQKAGRICFISSERAFIVEGEMLRFNNYRPRYFRNVGGHGVHIIAISSAYRFHIIPAGAERINCRFLGESLWSKRRKIVPLPAFNDKANRSNIHHQT